MMGTSNMRQSLPLQVTRVGQELAGNARFVMADISGHCTRKIGPDATFPGFLGRTEKSCFRSYIDFSTRL